MHAERLARLNRALRLAEAAGNGKLAVRVRVLIDLENARHDMNMMALRGP
jgi:ribosomal protein L15E